MDITLFRDPFENPDWRWFRVKSLITEGQQPTQQDDKYIHRGYKFSKAVEDCDGSDTARYAISLKYKDMAKTVGLSNNGANRKFYLEALLLCQDVGEIEIANYMGLSPYTVRYYAKLFFDVRDHLTNSGYICSRILEPAIMKTLEDFKDPNIAWKLAALFGGFDVVKVCWELRDAPTRAKMYYKNAGMSALLKDFGVGTHLRPVNKWNAEHIADHVLKFAEIEMKNAALHGGAQSEERVEQLKEIMGSIQFFVADPNERPDPREPRLFELVKAPGVSPVSGE